MAHAASTLEELAVLTEAACRHERLAYMDRSLPPHERYGAMLEAARRLMRLSLELLDHSRAANRDAIQTLSELGRGGREAASRGAA